MQKEGFGQLIGQFVKLVVQEPGQEIHTIYGTLLDIGNGFVLFKSRYGIGSFNLQYVIAIKPREGREGEYEY